MSTHKELLELLDVLGWLGQEDLPTIRLLRRNNNVIQLLLTYFERFIDLPREHRLQDTVRFLKRVEIRLEKEKK